MDSVSIMKVLDQKKELFGLAKTGGLGRDYSSGTQKLARGSLFITPKKKHFVFSIWVVMNLFKFALVMWYSHSHS